MGIICLFLIESCLQISALLQEKKKKSVFFKVTHEQFLASKDRDQNKLQLLPMNYLFLQGYGASLNLGYLGTGSKSTK